MKSTCSIRVRPDNRSRNTCPVFPLKTGYIHEAHIDIYSNEYLSDWSGLILLLTIYTLLNINMNWLSADIVLPSVVSFELFGPGGGFGKRSSVRAGFIFK